MIFRTHLSVRLGDNIAHLHFLRKLAAAHPEHRFIHYSHINYLPNLIEIVADLNNVQVCSLESATDGGEYWSMAPRPLLGSIDAWKNAGGFWESHPKRTDYCEFMIQHFRRLAKQMGLESPIIEVSDLLMDYPALAFWEFPKFDMLVINSAPQSNQMPGYDPQQLDLLVGELSRRHNIVTTARTKYNCPCTMGKQMTISQIGALSRFCKYIVAVATGPIWGTWNTLNRDSIESRVIMIGDERLNFGGKIEHAESIDGARKALQLQGLL